LGDVAKTSGMLVRKSPPRFIGRFAVIVTLGILCRPVDAQAVTMQTQVQTVAFTNAIYLTYNYSKFIKFDTKLGTLRAVSLKLNSFSLGGSFTFNQGSTGGSTITAFNTGILFYAASSLNNTANNGLKTNFDVGSLPKTGSIAVTNQTLPKTIARRTSATFNFDATRNILTSPVVVLNLSATNDLAFYKGTGISFAPAFTSVTQFLATGSYGGTPTRDYTQLTTTVNMSLYYDYIPAAIPEPSYYGLGLSLATVGLCLGRRYAKRKDRPPAV
jgi:hypothetical protein